MRSFGSLSAVFALLMVPLSSLAQAVYPQVPITITEQTLSAFVSSTTSASGTPSVAVPFDGTINCLTAEGTVTSSNVGGIISVSIYGAASNSGGCNQEIKIQLNGALSFVVPDSSYGGVSLPTTTLVQTLTPDPPAAGYSSRYWFGLVGGVDNPVEPSSSLLGNRVVFFGLYGLDIPYDDPIRRRTSFFYWPSGDEVILPFLLSLDIQLDDGATIPINETATYELRYIPLPEPNASLTVPAGVGLLAGLAKLRGVPLVP